MRERLVETLRLHLVTDSALCGERGVLAVVEAAVAGGVSCVQLREKSLPTRAFVERARALKAWLAPRAVPLKVWKPAARARAVSPCVRAAPARRRRDRRRRTGR